MIYQDQKLQDVDSRLQDLVHRVSQKIPVLIICGRRTDEEQHQAFLDGKSQVDVQGSKHNTDPATAIDMCCIPNGFTYNQIMKSNNYLFFFAGLVLGIAMELNYPVRWGGDWNSNNIFTDQSLMDYCHFELI